MNANGNGVGNGNGNENGVKCDVKCKHLIANRPTPKARQLAPVCIAFPIKIIIMPHKMGISARGIGRGRRERASILWVIIMRTTIGPVGSSFCN